MKLYHLGLIIIVVCSACHTIRVDISNQTEGEIIKDRKSYFLLGIVPTHNIDMKSICPQGTVRITENTSFFDGFLGIITLGIYTPRTTIYTCALEGE